MLSYHEVEAPFNLVEYHQMNQNTLQTISEWFDGENVIKALIYSCHCNNTLNKYNHLYDSQMSANKTSKSIIFKSP